MSHWLAWFSGFCVFATVAFAHRGDTWMAVFCSAAACLGGAGSVWYARFGGPSEVTQ